VCCNPPFYESREGFLAETLRKQSGLLKNKAKKRNRPIELTGAAAKSAARSATATGKGAGGGVGQARDGTPSTGKSAPSAAAAAAAASAVPSPIASSDNFGGGASELWCPGGEV